MKGTFVYKPFVRLGLTLKKYKKQILSHFKHRKTNYAVECSIVKLKLANTRPSGTLIWTLVSLELYHFMRFRGTRLPDEQLLLLVVDRPSTLWNQISRV